MEGSLQREQDQSWKVLHYFNVPLLCGNLHELVGVHEASKVGVEQHCSSGPANNLGESQNNKDNIFNEHNNNKKGMHVL